MARLKCWVEIEIDMRLTDLKNLNVLSKKVFIIFILTFYSIISFAQEIDEMLDKNVITYNDLVQNDSMQTAISQSFECKKVFFIAETHELEINTEYQLFFLKFLHTNAGVRNLITEYSYGTAFLIDQYLKSGDTLFLNARANKKYQQYEDYWKELYKWNKSLPADQHISVYGIGRYNWPIIAPLYFCIPEEKEIPEEIKSEIEIINQLFTSNNPPSYYGNGFDSKDNQKLRKSLRRKLEKYPELTTYFGSNYIHVENITNNYAAYKPTDASMFKNFNELHDELEGNTMLVFGSYHCFLDRWTHKYDPLAKLINESNNYKNQVYSTIGYFDNCTSGKGASIYDDGLKPFLNSANNNKLIEKAFENVDFSILNLDNVSLQLLKDQKRYANLLFLMKDQSPSF